MSEKSVVERVAEAIEKGRPQRAAYERAVAEWALYNWLAPPPDPADFFKSPEQQKTEQP